MNVMGRSFSFCVSTRVIFEPLAAKSVDHKPFVHGNDFFGFTLAYRQ
jgi:hypothetical protein